MTKNEAIDILYTQLTVLQCTGESDRHANDVIDAIRMAIESLGTNVAYICDEDACAECGQEFIRDCYHTTITRLIFITPRISKKFLLV